MDDDVLRWNRVKQVFQDALERRADKRGMYVRDACGDDRGLQREVESLLTAHAAAGSFAQGPAIEALAPSAAVALRDGGGFAVDLQTLQPGIRLGKYRIERQLGQGGMGVVFLAHDATLDRGVAIKVLGRSDDDEMSHTRLLREARNASALNHPNICTVYEVGELNGLSFIAMEYVDGRSLRDLVADGPLPVQDAVRYAIEAADALAHAHDRGVVHRDLKAANTIISSSARLKIVDFGLARRIDPLMSGAKTQTSLAGPGVAVGTPYAMAPEQVRGGVADARTDLWALGVLLYEMLTGDRPFSGTTVAELFSAILRDSPAPLPPSISDALREILHTCLARDPAERYQRAADVRLMLEAVDSGLRRRDPPSDRRVVTGAPLPASPLIALAVGASGFVGREPEIAHMERAWTLATTGQRQLLLLAGEPGIGKTRLALEFSRVRAESAATVLVGRCDEEALVPYQPFVEALTWYARVCPERDLRAQLAAIGGGAELGPLIPELLRRVPDLSTQPAMHPEGRRYRLLEAVAALLAQASRVRPVMLVFDDLHWADKPTLLMLRHVMRASTAASLCIVGTYRDSELARTHPLAEMLADLRRQPSVTRLVLRGLEPDQVNVLVNTFVGRDVSPSLARLVADSTEGNPFFIGEMLRHLTETGALATLRDGSGGRKSATALGLPEGVKEVIGRRLARLSEACNRTLSLAAVIGREFDIEILEALDDLPEDRILDAIDEGVRAQLIAEAPYRAGRFSFVHALIRETLYGELTTTRRVRLHRRVGAAIEGLARGRSDQPLADLAYHFVQAASAEVADKAIDYATRAGDRAADALAHEEAARLYDMALQSLDLKPASHEADVRRADLHTRRARAFGALAQWAAEKPDLEQALRYLDPQQIERRAELLVELTAASFWLLDLPAVERWAPEALDLAERVQRSDLAANAIAWLAHAQSGHGDLTAAIEMGRAAIARASGARTIAHAMLPLYLYLAGRATDGIACGVQATEMARASRDTTFTMYALAHHALSLGSVGRYTEAAAVFEEVRQFGRKYGVLQLLARATAMAAGFHLSVFDFEGGVALASEAREFGRSAGFLPSVVSAGIDLLLMFARRRDPGGAEGLLPETAAAAVGATGSHRWLWELRLTQVRAELALARGAFDTAVVEASDGINQAHTTGRPKYQALGLITKANALHGLGRTRDAIVAARQGVVVARGTADPALLLLALDAVLALDGDDESLAEARTLDGRISSALPDETIRQRFVESDVVQRVRRL
jgi:predicted Ser/Thr protein kinase/tetratricopeptide (TPR) repeat protein